MSRPARFGQRLFIVLLASILVELLSAPFVATATEQKLNKEAFSSTSDSNAKTLKIATGSATTDDKVRKLPRPAPPEHRCIHGTLKPKVPNANNTMALGNPDIIIEGVNDGELKEPATRSRRLARAAMAAADFQPLRIYVYTDDLDNDAYTCYAGTNTVQNDHINGGLGPYTCTSSDILTADKRTYLLDTMVANAVQRFNQILSVNRALQPGNLILSSDYYSPTVGSGYSASNNSQCDGSGLTVLAPSLFWTSGVDADFILLVTSRPIPQAGYPNVPPGEGRTLAYATPCLFDSIGRPVLGWANFDPSAIDPTDDSVAAMQLGVAIHEMTHSLGFTWSMISTVGAFKSYNDGVYSSIPADEIYSQGSNENEQMIITPTVLEYVRQHFNCPTLEGAMLEDGGGAGTELSHWEKAAFMNEYMTGTASNNPIVSALTFALLNDSGWYRTNFSATDSFGYGYGGGCAMAEDWTGCKNWPASYTCDADDQVDDSASCVPDLTGYGQCVQETSSTSLIGDGCEYYTPSTMCLFPFPPNSAAALALASNGLISSGESYADDSRCFLSTLNQVDSLSNLFPVPGLNTQHCYRTHCTSTTELRIYVEGYWYPCNYTYGNSIAALNFGGSITCPPQAADLLCQNVPYDYEWPRLKSVSPALSAPSTTVTVTGTGFDTSSPMYFVIETELTNIVVTNTTISGTLASYDFWGSPRYLDIFNTQLDVIVADSQNRSDVLILAFQADIGFNLSYLAALATWVGQNPIVSALVIIVLIAPCICIACCCYKKCNKKKKPVRGQYDDQYANADDELYYDEEMDDRPRNAAPVALSYY